MSNTAEERLQIQLERLQRENKALREHASTESNSRLMAEVALGKTEDHLQLAVSAAGLSMWEWDIVDETLFSSPQFHETVNTLGGTSGEDPPWSPQDLLRNISTDDRELLRLALVQLFAQQRNRLEVEYRVNTSLGPRWIECTGQVTQRNMLGQVERMTGISRDVTRRREIQQEVEGARAQAVAANAAKDEFLAHISHEIRTPLNGVIGMNNLLAQTSLTEEQRQYVELVGSSGRALLALVNDVLDYSRLQAQKLVLEQVRFPLRRWLWDVVAPMRVAAQAKGLDLLIDASETLPKEAVGDPGRLRQIVTNLVSNAIKFTQQGSIDVSMSLTHADATQMMLQLRVTDTGIGISAQQQQLVFDPFVQADNSTSRRYGGTGLGLSICVKLAEMMGGRIELSSTLGHGSCFTVHVPLAYANFEDRDPDFGVTELAGADMTLPSHAQNAAVNYSGKRALVVDDHRVNQLLATRLLQLLGFAVEVAGDGEQAVQAVKAGWFDVVLMDIQMPRMDGWQATHHIRQWELEQRKARVPVIALSAHAAAADREHAIAVGMDGYLSKPLTTEALQAGLRATGLGQQLATANQAALRDKRPLAQVDLPLPEPAPALVPMPGATTVPGAGLVSRERLLARVGHDEAALHEVAQVFCNELRDCLGLAFEGLQKQDWQATRAQAHALKGLLLGITADAAAGDARTLEQAVLAADRDRANAAFARLSDSAKTVFDTVRRW